MRGCRKNRGGKGKSLIAFSVGLIIATFCPYSIIILLLAISLILLGLSYAKH